MDIQLEPFAQRKGLGRHLMRTLEMIARKQVRLRMLEHDSSLLLTRTRNSAPITATFRMDLCKYW
jgi:hypothetical protein